MSSNGKKNSVNIVTKAHPPVDTVMSDASHFIQVIMINRGKKGGTVVKWMNKNSPLWNPRNASYTNECSYITPALRDYPIA